MKGFETLAEDFENQRVFQSNFFWEIDVPDGFEDWFRNNGEYFSPSKKSIPIYLNVTQTTAGQCFHNSQLLCINNEVIDYYEGIIYGPKYKTALHHGFSILNKSTIDITYIYNKEKFHNEDRRDKNYIYFGVKIPKEFILKYSKNIKIPNQQNPLIVEYYKAFLANTNRKI